MGSDRGPRARRPPPPHLQPGPGPSQPKTILDLPTDVLSYILSLVAHEVVPPYVRHGEGGFDATARVVRLAVTCKAFAAAITPPCAVWSRFQCRSSDLWPTMTVGAALTRALARAGPSILAFRLQAVAAGQGTCEPPGSTIQDAAQFVAERIAPYLLDLQIHGISPTWNSGDNLAWVQSILAAAPRLECFRFNNHAFRCPPPLLAGAAADIFAFCKAWIKGLSRPMVFADVYGRALGLHRTLTAAAAVRAAVGPIALTHLGGIFPPLTMDWAQVGTDFGPVDRLADVSVWAGPEVADPRALGFEPPAVRLAALVAGLPGLERLRITTDADVSDEASHMRQHNEAMDRRLWGVHRLRSSGRAVAVDLRGVAAPPPSLASLTVGPANGEGDVLLSAPLRAQLAELAVEFRALDHPPRCLHGVGHAFSRLTRLEYGADDIVPVYLASSRGFCPVNLAAWGHDAWSVPTLVDLRVTGYVFEVRDYVGPDWAAAVATATLPRLARLVLSTMPLTRDNVGKFPGTEAFRHLVTRRLPAAAAKAGRRLAVHVDVDEDAQVRGGHAKRQGRPLRSLFDGFVLEYVRAGE